MFTLSTTVAQTSTRTRRTLGRSRSSSRRASSGSRCGSAASAARGGRCPSTRRDRQRLRPRGPLPASSPDRCRARIRHRPQRAVLLPAREGERGQVGERVPLPVRRLDVARRQGHFAARRPDRSRVRLDGAPDRRAGPHLGRSSRQGHERHRDCELGSRGRRRRAVRRELGIGDHVPLVVCIAQLAEWKRQHLLVHAFARVVPRFPDASSSSSDGSRSPGGGPEGRSRTSCEG